MDIGEIVEIVEIVPEELPFPADVPDAPPVPVGARLGR